MATAQQVFSSTDESLLLYQSINSQLSEGKVKGAIETFNKVIAFYENENREQEIPQGYFAMALALALNDNYKKSIRFHKKAIRIHRKYRNDEPLEIEINLGLTYQLAGKNKKARKILGEELRS